MDKLRRALSGDDGSSSQDEETGIMGPVSSIGEYFTELHAFTGGLQFKTRVKGFIILFLVGLVCSFFGSFCLFFGLGLGAFGVFYTLGNIVSMGSTCFLMGPMNQLKKMFAPTRVIATVMVIVMFALTLFAAFVVKRPPLVLLFIILQSLAMTWYSLSYIPYARDLAKKAVSSCIA